MPEPYSYLVVYDLGDGDANTFWAIDVTRTDDEVMLHGYKGQKLQLSYATPYCIKEKPRHETPNYVIGRVEGLDPSEVAKLDDEVQEPV